MKKNEMKKILVHGGVFHSDDAMAVAIAKAVNPGVEVGRIFRVPEDLPDGTVVADIGGGRYDHHQAEARRRPSGEKYAACGLLLEDYWDQIFPNESSYRRFEQDVIIPIELADNGVQSNPLSVAVSSFVPAWDSDEGMDDAFSKAVEFCSGILERAVARAKSQMAAEALVMGAYDASDKEVVVLPQFAPWQEYLVPTDAKYVVFPSNRGGHNLQAVPAELGSFAMKRPLPEEWLDEAMRPEGCTFVHANRFLASFHTLEDAVKAAETAL